MESKTVVHTRIDNDVLEFIKQQANKDGRTQSGMINFILQNEKNRVENRKRKDNE